MNKVLQDAVSEKGDRHRVKRLEKLLEEQAEALERARAPRHGFGKSKKHKQKGGYCRVVIPDTHGSSINVAAAKAFLDDLECIQPREIVMLGDHVECGGFLAQHHTLGYVAQTAYTFEEDVAAANQFLDEIAKRCPKARVDYLFGNHEQRVEAWIVNQTLRHPVDAAFLNKRFSIESVLSLQKRNINYYLRSVKYDGLPVMGTIKRGKCHFTHSTRTGQYAASTMLRDFAGNVVFGHTHTPSFFTRTNVNSGTIAAWNPGCLCELVQYWHHTSNMGHAHGYGLQNVDENEDFLHINVPIVDGRSLLVPLTQMVA